MNKLDKLNNKSFTVIFSIVYTVALVCVFSISNSFEYLVVFAFSAFLALSFFILFFNLGFKKALILYLIFLLGLIRAKTSIKDYDIFYNLKADNVVLTGQIDSNRQVLYKTSKAKFYLQTKEARIFNKNYKGLNSKILVVIPLEDNNVAIGDNIKIEGRLHAAKNAKNPYQFDYKKYLENNDCSNILYAKPGSLEKISDAQDFWHKVLAKFEIIRNKIITQHAKNIKSPRLEILGGIVFGNETINPDDNIKEYFRNSGLLHLLAASGLNVALIYGIWWWIAGLIKLPYRISILSGALFVVFYTFMTGFPPSILRASLMLLFVLFGKLIDRDADSVSLIFFVGFLILLFSPKMFFDIGFELSFAVTLGLIAICPAVISKFGGIDKKFKEKHKDKNGIIKYFIHLFLPSNLFCIFLVPLVAQLCVIPLQMHYFNTFCPFSVFANVCVVPFIGLLSFVGFLSSIFALIPFLNKYVVFLFDFIANPFLWLLIKVSEVFASFKYSIIQTPSLNVFQIFAFWTILALFVLNLKNNFKLKKHAIAFVAILLVFFASFIKLDNIKNVFYKHLEIIAFDVENADCFLIKTPKNKYILIDTGKKTFSNTTSAQVVLNRYFRNERIKKIDVLIITHFDIDHCGGTIDILDNFRVGKIYIQKEEAKSDESEKILKYLKENKLNYKVAKNDETIYFEPDFSLKTYKSNLVDDNESSVVAKINYKDKNLLFMADCGTRGFYEIEKYLTGDKIHILKIGHHGAGNTIDKHMLNVLHPDFALISAGDKFNHPHYSTLNLLRDNDVKVITTKDYGFIKIDIQDKKIDFYYYDFNKKKLQSIIFKKLKYQKAFDELRFDG